MEDKGTVTGKYTADRDGRMLLAGVIDKERISREKGILTTTAFMSEGERAMCEKFLRGEKLINFKWFGGYENAERRMLAFYPEWMDGAENGDFPIAYIRAVFSEENMLSHRDFLGAVMGLLIKREMIGDILPEKGSCDMIVSRNVAPVILSSLDKVGRANVKTAEISQGDLNIPEARFVVIKDTVASLRIDSVISSGFKKSRESAARDVLSKKVSVNGLVCEKPDKTVGEGDTITCRGDGKMEISSVSGLSRKGRVIIEIKRFV